MSDPFYDVLQPIALAARGQTSTLLHLVCHCNDEDLVHMSEVSAYYAYATVAAWQASVGRQSLNEQAANQELQRILHLKEPPLDALGQVRTLNVDQHHALLVQIAKLWLGRHLQGRGSNYFDWRRRNSTRRAAPEAPWQAWRYASEHQYPTPGVPHYVPQEEEWRDHQLGELEQALTKVLNPWEMYVLREHFLRGRRQREIARELAERDPAYAGDWERAEKWVGKTVQRALVRARKRLGGAWHELRDPSC